MFRTIPRIRRKHGAAAHLTQPLLVSPVFRTAQTVELSNCMIVPSRCSTPKGFGM